MFTGTAQRHFEPFIKFAAKKRAFLNVLKNAQGPFFLNDGVGFRLPIEKITPKGDFCMILGVNIGKSFGQKAMINKFKPLQVQTKDNLHINFNKKQITGTLTVHTFDDHGHVVSYCPTLNLSAYGENKNEAMHRLIHDVIDDFFSDLTKNQEAGLAELAKLGWKQEVFFKKRFVSESFVDREGILRNFNLPETTLVETSTVSTTAAA